jgi:hypothetical protein
MLLRAGQRQQAEGHAAVRIDIPFRQLPACLPAFTQPRKHVCRSMPGPPPGPRTHWYLRYSQSTGAWWSTALKLGSSAVLPGASQVNCESAAATITHALTSGCSAAASRKRTADKPYGASFRRTHPDTPDRTSCLPCTSARQTSTSCRLCRTSSTTSFGTAGSAAASPSSSNSAHPPSSVPGPSAAASAVGAAEREQRKEVCMCVWGGGRGLKT